MSFPLSRWVIRSCSFALAAACSAAPEEVTLEPDLGEAQQALARDATAATLDGDGAMLAAHLGALAADRGALAPVTTGPLSSARHTCEGSYCTCTGDPECNDMFSGSDCATGPKTAVCQIRDDVPKCRCTKAAKAD